MAITLLVGAPGHGKSYTLIRRIEEAVSKGKPVATNVPLRDDWAFQMARRHTFMARFRKDAVIAKAAKFSRFVIMSTDFDKLLRVRLSGDKEGRGLLVLDEAHRWMNARGWDNAMVVNDDGSETQMKRGDALAKRLRVINHLSAHRHYGFDVILATQSDRSIDNQARELYEFHAEVRNMRRLPWFGAVFRFNLFLCVTRWNDKAKSKAGVSCYWLNKSLANLYSTHALQEADWPEDAIVLPLPA